MIALRHFLILIAVFVKYMLLMMCKNEKVNKNKRPLEDVVEGRPGALLNSCRTQLRFIVNCCKGNHAHLL